MTTSIRIVGTYKKEHFITTSIERIEMLCPTSEPLDDFKKVIGFWMELRNKLDEPLYRLIMPDPFRAEVEVFNINEDKTMSSNMILRDKISGHLVLLVPDKPDASYVALVRSTVDTKTEKLNVLDVIRIPLKNK